ncbi:DUF1294 domain-containing protein [Clostridium sp. AF19-22AC]|jgi:uncharacterized membrane protein YsdA (DUF1294 family)|uniref:DUF1294 domain-containing protein n=1 Tax=Clostridia TaxID=186801 RepID=UPI000E4E6B99|nr:MULTISPECIES: DUF1294 domain-containing protein [Clostridia]RHR30301.1 DUF1294 domain-containing protein [Clostridium sp. AF19-22AC]
MIQPPKKLQERRTIVQHKYIIIYLILINLITFFTYGADKQKARKNKWRIPENTLILLALSGGSIGAYLAMQTFRHKTQKPKFKIGIPIIILLHAALLVRLIW